MSLNFPASPSNNQIYFDATSGNRYKYNAVNNVWFFVANNNIQGGASDAQIIFDDAGAANGNPGLTFNKTANILREAFSDYKNLHFLDKQSVVIDGVKFVGCSLWTEVDTENPLTINKLKFAMNDFNLIKY